jgi:outer membrane protein
MRSLLSKFFGAGLLAGLLGGTAWAQAQPRLATVDLGKLVNGYYKTKQAREAFDARQAELDKEYAKMLKDFDTSRKAWQALREDANNQILSEDERKKRGKQAEDKLKDLRETEDSIAQYKRTALAKLDEEWHRLLLKVFDDIKSVIEAKAKAGGYALVLDASGETTHGTLLTPFILYNSGENDLTQGVLEQLNAVAPAAPDAKAAEKPQEKK